MATTFQFYKDASLTQPYNPGTDTLGPVSNPPEDFSIYLGSTDGTKKLVAQTNPGVDPIILSVADADPGSDLEATDVKLALTSGGLAGATGGADLGLPATILGGVGNAVEIFIRVSYTGAIAYDVDVSLQLTADEAVI